MSTERRMADPDKEWRVNAARQISRRIPLNIRTVFDQDDAYGVALGSLENHRGVPRPFQYRCAQNAVVDALRKVAGAAGRKFRFTTDIPEYQERTEECEGAVRSGSPISEKMRVGPYILDAMAAPCCEEPEQHLMDKTDLGPFYIAKVEDPQQRRVLELIFLEGVEFGKDNETAKRLMGMSNASVSRLKHKALAAVKQIMEQEYK